MCIPNNDHILLTFSLSMESDRIPRAQTCEEMIRLVEEHHRAALAYARAVRALNHKRKVSSSIEYQRLREIADDEARKSEKARLALGRHQAEHGC